MQLNAIKLKKRKEIRKTNEKMKMQLIKQTICNAK